MRQLSRVLSISLQAAFGLGIAVFGTGCGALGALTNPRAAFAIQEPAPMSVVVRRAEVARGTAEQVDRLLGSTGIDAKSKWTGKTAMKADDADKLLKELGNEPVYAGQHVRVMTAEAWLSNLEGICSEESKYPSLLASITPELASAYAEVAKQERQIASLRAQIALEDKVIDDKDQAAQKDAHQAKKKELEDQVSKAEDEAKPKVEKFLTAVREESGKAGAEVKERVSVAVVNLKRAVDDAKLSNSVAIVRYPLAVPKLSTDAQEAAKRIVGDVVEERIGTRPDMNAVKLDVKLDGANVKIALTGGGADKLGAIAPDEVIGETTKRLKAYVGSVLTLVAYAGETQDKLGFETKILDALSDGLKLGAPSAEAGIDIADVKIETMGVGKPSIHHKGAHSAVGLVASACAKHDAEPAVAAAASDEKVDAKAMKGAKAAVKKIEARVDAKKEPLEAPVKIAEKKEAKLEAKTALKVEIKEAPKPVAKVVEVKDKPVAVSAPKKPAPAPAAAPAPKPAAQPAGDGPCDVALTSGGKTICL